MFSLYCISVLLLSRVHHLLPLFCLQVTAGAQQTPTRKSHHFLPSHMYKIYHAENKYSFSIDSFPILKGTGPFPNKMKWKKIAKQITPKESKNLPAYAVDFKKASKTRTEAELPSNTSPVTYSSYSTD